MSKSVFIDGATGYVGTHLVAQLTKTKSDVRCLVRPNAADKDVEFLNSCGAKTFASDLNNQAVVSKAMSGAEVAVHLIGSIAPKKGESFEQLHNDQTASLIKQCKHNGIEKIIMVTALGSAQDAVSNYHRTKWSSEETLRASGLKFIIMQPSLLIGHQAGSRDSKLIKRLINIITTKKMVPLVNGGKNKIQPLFIGDLVLSLEKAIQLDAINNRCFELGGPEVVSMNQFVHRLMNNLKLEKKIINLPGPVAYTIASICEVIQAIPLLSRDQVLMSQKDNICKNNAIDTVFGITPKNIASALETYHNQNAEALPTVLS